MEVLSAGQSSKGTIHITQHHLIVHGAQGSDDEVWVRTMDSLLCLISELDIAAVSFDLPCDTYAAEC